MKKRRGHFWLDVTACFLIPAYTLRDIDKQNLCELAILDPFPSLHLVLSWKPETYQLEPVRRFRKFVIEYFRRLADSGAPERPIP